MISISIHYGLINYEFTTKLMKVTIGVLHCGIILHIFAWGTRMPAATCAGELLLFTTQRMCSAYLCMQAIIIYSDYVWASYNIEDYLKRTPPLVSTNWCPFIGVCIFCEHLNVSVSSHLIVLLFSISCTCHIILWVMWFASPCCCYYIGEGPPVLFVAEALTKTKWSKHDSFSYLLASLMM